MSMKIKNKTKLIEVIKELSRIQGDIDSSVIELNDNEINTEVDIYAQIRDVIDNIEELIKYK